MTIGTRVVDPDPHQTGRQDPDPHQRDKLDPYPHKLANDKAKCMENEPIAFICKLQDPLQSDKQDPDPHQSDMQDPTTTDFILFRTSTPSSSQHK